MVRSIVWLTLLVAAPAVVAQSPEDLRRQLCERGLLVGGPLEEYLAGVGVDDAVAVARARELFGRLVEAHPDLPESYVRLSVLMAAEEGAEVQALAAEATLEVLAGCRGEGEEQPPPPSSDEPAFAMGQPSAAVPEPAVEPLAEEEVAEPVAEPVAELVEADVEAADPPAIGDPRQAFLDGVALAERGAVADAAAVFRSLIATYPQLPEPYVNLAALLAVGGDEAEASLMAESALLVHPLCRSALEFEMLLDFGDHSRSLVADLGRSEDRRRPPNRVVGPDWIPSPGDRLEEIREIAETLTAWLRAWSERRIDDYLGFYADHFRPAEGDVRRWRAERRSHFAGSQPVELEISGLDVDAASAVTGSASFNLRSRSGGTGVAVIVDKRLELEKTGDGWRIVAERPGE